MKQKLLYIVPHLSTGGMPQYLLKQIESFKNDFDIYVIEYNNLSDLYTVQKNKIKNLVNLHTLGENKLNSIFYYINLIRPDIIHFQEIPEHFIDFNILREIYIPKYGNRNYFILVTTHSSLVDPSKLTFLADKFILVNEWSKQKFLQTGIDCDIWEYPIEKTTNQPYYRKRILNIGLFTPGKNQGEIFDIARRMPNYYFNFVGNQAPNFEFYWGPLMKNKPENCKIWGEREDVENFYKTNGIFYFASKFELNPLVVKEALSYNLPVLMYKLETYLDTYDNNPLVYYLNDLTIEQKINLINSL